MDAVSGAGSVIAVVTIALQSTKAIYETFTGIHNGPIFLKQLTSELRTLQDVLASIADLSKDPAQANTTKFQQLKGLSQQCVTDLQSMEAYLTSLSGGRRVGRAWNTLKTYLNTKRLEEFRARVQNHVHALTAAVGVATM
jgi:hypothetical protein